MSLLLRIGPARSSCAFLACRKHAFSTTASCARAKPHWLMRKDDQAARHAALFPRAEEKARDPGRRDAKHTYKIFRNLMLGKYDLVMNSSRSWIAKANEYKGFGIDSKLDLDREVKLFRTILEKACDLAEMQVISKSNNRLFWTLRNAFIEGDQAGLASQLAYSFQDFLMRSRFPKGITATHKKIADFRFPYEWFPATRALQRTIYLHVGPTNSGKTYNALKALENAKSGIYAGPLRLLAHEVYTRFVAKGKPCALITGEEQRIPEDEDNYFRSCTVEMTPLNHLVDVAVIDEIQMIGDIERGWAWTQAFLGVQAKEVHLCGEERTVELIQSLCATIGDKCIVTRYNRLSPLETMEKSLGGSLKNLEKGDAVVTFSRLGIHTLKKQIEEATGRRCAMIYGSLPPETRAQQATLFNDPDNDYDFLVASDAIGMGLNLEIKRVVFEQTHKRSSVGYRQISTSGIKQIGGRAGRFRTARQAAISETELSGPVEMNQPGLVTAFENGDLKIIKDAFSREPEPIKSAGIQPPPSVVERFSSYFPPNTAFSYIISRLRDIAQTSPRFHLCHLKEMLDVAELIQPFPMSVYDRCVFLNAPVALRERSGSSVVQSFAKCISRSEGGNLVDVAAVDLELLDIDEDEFQNSPGEYLQRLEALHKTITLYLWLSYRYTGVFRSQNLAFHVKGLVEEKIDAHLGKFSVSEAQRKARIESIRRKAESSLRQKGVVLGDDASTDEHGHELHGEWNEEGHEEPLFDISDEIQPITRLEPNSTTATAARSGRTHRSNAHA
ncbi:P-loop containing nucleoside triphosphate hydrolase protein [Annulohypoxylon bovei var. microspora]|nr:P-loop containing nucleoside triphosphate hydrolase protein [Annulohypoxylon bovei var. microspora]